MVRVKDQLKALSVVPSKLRGQNFVISPSVIDEILEFAKPNSGERLVEIGPGLGVLTRELIKIAPTAVVEIESKFCNKLKEDFPSLTIINDDIRNVSLDQFGDSVVVFGNVPYSISTDIIFHLIDQRRVVKRAILLLQKEFVNRLGAKPSTKDYGTISIAIQLWADVILGPVISGDSFHPRVEVDSRLIEIRFLEESRYPVEDHGWFRKVVKAAFSKRRKTLVNSLAASGLFSRELINNSLLAIKVDPMRRAETLSIREFVGLAQALKV